MKGTLISVSDRLLLRKRAIIETVNDELKNISQVEHSRHRCFDNFIVNLLGAIAAYCLFPKKPCINVQRTVDTQLALLWIRRTHVILYIYHSIFRKNQKNILQFRTHKDLIIKRKPFISVFITHAVPTGYKTENKRCPFTLQKGVFYTSKEHLLSCKRASFTVSKVTYCF